MLQEHNYNRDVHPNMWYLSKPPLLHHSKPQTDSPPAKSLIWKMNGQQESQDFSLTAFSAIFQLAFSLSLSLALSLSRILVQQLLNPITEQHCTAEAAKHSNSNTTAYSDC